MKLRPHLPHGCMPDAEDDDVAFGAHRRRSRRRRRRPHVDEVLVLVVGVQRRRSRAASPCRRCRSAACTPRGDLAEHDDPLVGRARPRRARTARTDRRRRTEAAARSGSRCTTRCGPGATARWRRARSESHVGVGARALTGREHDRAAHRALAPMRCGSSPVVNHPSTAGTRVTVSDTPSDYAVRGGFRSGGRHDRDEVRGASGERPPYRCALEPGAARAVPRPHRAARTGDQRGGHARRRAGA